MCPQLHAQLDVELPREVAVGAGTAVFVCGWCFCPQAAIERLELLLDGHAQPVDSRAMPRLDPYRATGEAPHSYRSGFWGLVTIEHEPPGGEYELGLRAALRGGDRAEAELGRIAVAQLEKPLAVDWPAGAAGPRVAIAMAAYEPPAELLARQLESIRGQTHANWVCLISDDCSSPAGHERLRAAIAGDPRFVLSRSPRRLGFYGNFERALSLVPADAEYVAMADQDDVWREDKLARLLGAIGQAQLIYSDARVVGAGGEVISETWWDRRRNNHSDLLSLLVANSVTGAASLMRRELLERALPFPPGQFHHFHDHWIGLVARTMGEIAYLPEPLYDYVQHGQASLGHEQANRMTSLRERLGRQRRLRTRVRLWRLHYFVDIWRLRQFAAVLLMRAGRNSTADRRRTLERFLASDRSLIALAQMGARGLRELVGTTETLGAEWGLFHALAWRRLLALTARSRPQGRLRLDALPPPSLVLEPGRLELEGPVAELAEKIEPLRWRVSDAAPARVNLLIPTIDLEHFFGGYIAKFNLARRLAERGARVRIVTVDPVGALPGDWRARIESYAQLAGLFDAVEVAFGRESAGLECSRRDAFIATTWWTAHIARAALEHVSAEGFAYLIQEYEPFTFPMGSHAALAEDSYRQAHFALFSSRLLRDYFAAHRIGVFSRGAEAGERDSAAFENAITTVAPPTAAELASRATRRLLLYARPEAHAARNMFELAALALARCVRDGTLAGWELNGIGSLGGGRHVALGGGVLNLLARRGQPEYAELLREHDVGLALMYTPHPSLVPLEMAAAGLLTVTNSFENKTPEALTAISANLLGVEPSVEAIAAGVRRAVAAAPDGARRRAGAEVDWSTSWEQSFPDQLIERLLAYLTGG